MKTINKITLTTLFYVILLIIMIILSLFVMIDTEEILLPMLVFGMLFIILLHKINKQSNKLEQYLDDKYNYSKYDESNDYLS